MNGNVSDSTDMAINRRAEVSVGVTGDGSYYFPGSGMTFPIQTIQEVEMRISPKEQQRLARKYHGRARVLRQRSSKA